MCGFYHTKQDYIAEVVPFLTSGLTKDELCIWVTSNPVEEEEAKGILEHKRYPSGESLPWDQVKIYPYEYWYLEDGRFSSQRAIGNATRSYEQALDQGYEGVRLTGNLSWLDPEYWASFWSYESEADQLIRGKKLKVLCSYRLDGLGESEIRDVVENHVRAVRRNTSWSLEDPEERTKAIHGIARENELRNAFLSLSIPDRLGELEGIFSEMETSLSGKRAWERIPWISESGRKMAERVEQWMDRPLDSLIRPPLSVKSMAEDLAEIHGRITGAEATVASASPKRVVLEIEGCPDLERCGPTGGLDLGSQISGEGPSRELCLADLVVGGILQAAVQTPMRIQSDRQGNICRKSILPAWYADVISGLEGIGVESILIVYGDRILLSHCSSAEHADALSESLLGQEEGLEQVQARGPGDSKADGLICSRSGDLTVSVCLAPGSSLKEAVDRVAEVTRRVRLSA